MEIQVNANNLIETPLNVNELIITPEPNAESESYETNIDSNTESVNRYELEDVYLPSMEYYNNYSLNNELPFKIPYYHNRREIIDNISKYGTISPTGEYMDTPENIKIELKPHQKRTLYEMTIRENYKRLITSTNSFLLCDNVGSGKSLCMLSLISNNPIVTNKVENIYNSHPVNDDYNNMSGIIYKDNTILEFNSNLIVVPHGIFNQWANYIIDYTCLTSYNIASNLAIQKLGNTQDILINNLNKYNIILVKSTMYNDFIRHLHGYGLRQITSHVSQSENNYTGISDDNATVKIDSISPNQFLNNIEDIVDILRDNIAKKLYDYIPDFNKHITDLCKSVDINVLKSRENTFVPKTNTMITGILFQRVIFDEADSIKIPSCMPMRGKYTWFITSSINNMLLAKGYRSNGQTLSTGISGSGFIKDTFHHLVSGKDKYAYTRIFHSIIRSNYSFIQDSIKIPDAIINYMSCFTPPDLQAVASALDADTLQALNAGDFKTALHLLGCTSGSEEDLVKIVNMTLYKKRDELIALLEERGNQLNDNNINIEELENGPQTEQNKEYLREYKTHNYSLKSSIENFTLQLAVVKNKITGIEERIMDIKSKSCPVCMSDIDNPCITPCCNNVFCLACITMAINVSKSCPLCRTKIEYKSLALVVEKKDNREGVVEPKPVPDANALLPKLDLLIKYINDNPNKKILVFSQFENTFANIEESFKNHLITYSKLNGSAGRIKNIINSYKSGAYRVLLLNAKNFGAGLNLQMTDDIIIYHRMSKDLERQVIGRAQRLGRTEPLNINYLCYENEYPIELIN